MPISFIAMLGRLSLRSTRLGDLLWGYWQQAEVCIEPLLSVVERLIWYPDGIAVVQKPLVDQFAELVDHGGDALRLV